MKILPPDAPAVATVLPPGSEAAPVPSAPAAIAPVAEVDAAALAPRPTQASVEQAVARANEQMAAVAPSLQFEIDPDTREIVIRLVDRQDRHVLRQVPAPEMLAIARALDRMQALLLRGKA